MKIIGGLCLILLLIAGGLFYQFGRSYWEPWKNSVMGTRTVLEVINQYGDSAREVLLPAYLQANVEYPGNRIALLATKNEQNLALWAQNAKGQWNWIRDYPILAASGNLGPKLKEGDKQVPEGIYYISWLHPNSAYHLSMKLNYPNPFDMAWAEKEGRTEPGTNIFIHGEAVSIGCLAIGNPAIEQLFVLVHDIGLSKVEVIIAPADPRLGPLLPPTNSPDWVSDLYSDIATAFLAVTGQATPDVQTVLSATE